MYNKLLENISKRLSSENALSDITWAYAITSESFRQCFLKFFFADYESSEKILSFKREYVRGNSRPDFYIQTTRSEYIIECKIFDRNHHFDDYRKSFPHSNFGYIANYKITNKENVQIRTWHQLHNFLQKEVESLQGTEEINLFYSYLSYLKQVCNINTIKLMKLNDINSLIQLNLTIRKVLNENPDLDEIDYDGKVKNLDDYRYGKYYGLKKIVSNIKIWPYIGVYFNADKVVIYTEINEEWCTEAFNYLKSENELRAGEYYDIPYFDDDYRSSYSLELKKQYFDELNMSQNVEEQERLIKQYIHEILDFLNSHY